MISRLVELEQGRLARAGYASFVDNVSVPVTQAEQVENLGNDIYILAGIRVSDESAADSAGAYVRIVSPTASANGYEQSLAQKGVAVHGVYRNNIVIKTRLGAFPDGDDEAYIAEHGKDTPPYELEFVRITPVVER